MSRVSVDHSQPRPLFGGKSFRGHGNKMDKKNTILIDVDSDYYDNVIIIDVPDSVPFQNKIRGPSVRGKGKAQAFTNIINIDDEDDDEMHDNEQSGGGVKNKSSYNAEASSSRNFSRAGDGATDKGKENLTPVRLSKCKRTYSGKGFATNHFGLDTDSEADGDASDNDDFPDCELMVDSSGRVQKQWEKAFFKRWKDTNKGDSGVGNNCSTSKGINENQGQQFGTEGETERTNKGPFSSDTNKSETSNGYKASSFGMNVDTEADACPQSDLGDKGSPFVHTKLNEQKDNEPESSKKNMDAGQKHTSSHNPCHQEQSEAEGVPRTPDAFTGTTTSAFKDSATPGLKTASANLKATTAPNLKATAAPAFTGTTSTASTTPSFKATATPGLKTASTKFKATTAPNLKATAAPAFTVTTSTAATTPSFTATATPGLKTASANLKATTAPNLKATSAPAFTGTTSTASTTPSFTATATPASTATATHPFTAFIRKCQKSVESVGGSGSSFLKDDNLKNFQNGTTRTNNKKNSVKKPGVSEKSSPDHIPLNEAEVRQDERLQNEDESRVISEREKLKETDEYKKAMDEEWASRQKTLQIQAEEAQRQKQIRKRKKAESQRLSDVKRRQKKRLEEMRTSQKKDEENMNLKEVIRAEVRKDLQKLELSCKNMASLLHSLGVSMTGWPNSLPKEVQTAYKKALLTFHPDRASRSDIRQQVEAEEKFKLVNRLKDKFSPSL